MEKEDRPGVNAEGHSLPQSGSPAVDSMQTPLDESATQASASDAQNASRVREFSDSPFQSDKQRGPLDYVLPTSRTPLKTLGVAVGLVAVGAALFVASGRTDSTPEETVAVGEPAPVKPAPAPSSEAAASASASTSASIAPVAVIPILPTPEAHSEAPKATTGPARTLSTRRQAVERRVHRYLSAADSVRARSLRRAELNYRRAIRLDRDNTRALEGLTRVNLEQHEERQAVVWARKLVRAEPNNAEGHTLLAQALEQAGQPRAARSELRKARQMERSR